MPWNRLQIKLSCACPPRRLLRVPFDAQSLHCRHATLIHVHQYPRSPSIEKGGDGLLQPELFSRETRKLIHEYFFSKAEWSVDELAVAIFMSDPECSSRHTQLQPGTGPSLKRVAQANYEGCGVRRWRQMSCFSSQQLSQSTEKACPSSLRHLQPQGLQSGQGKI